MDIFTVVKEIGSAIWGPPMLIFLMLAGIYLSLRLKGFQFTAFLKGIKLSFTPDKDEGEGNITSWQAYLGALGGIIGNGNIGGVATAIAVGGPGALFWMWLSAFVGMIIMYSESLLGIVYREKGEDGIHSGGPMYYIEKVLKLKWLAVLFAFCMGFKSLFATSSVQSNSMSLVVKNQFDIPMIVSCIIIAVLTWIVTIGGISKIAKTTEKLTPFMSILYLSAAFIIIFLNIDKLPGMFSLIIDDAFSGTSMAGGFAGATVLMAIRYGVARGFYSNEAGTGSVPIMHSSARLTNPVRQAIISMMSVVLDTLIICSITGFVILLSGQWISGESSTALASMSFGIDLGSYGNIIVLLSSLLFGYSTLIAWSFYGEQCFAYIFGVKVRKLYRWLFCCAILIGMVPDPEVIWSWGDILNGITVIVNIFALIFLAGHVMKLTREYISKI